MKRIHLPFVSSVLLAIVLIGAWTLRRVESHHPAAGPNQAPNPLRVATSQSLSSPALLYPKQNLPSPPQSTSESEPSQISSKTEATEADVAFRVWAGAYASAADQSDATILAEGHRLALRRRAQLSALIVSDPEAALELALPFSLRKGLPQSVRSELEEPLSFRGDLQVLATVPGDNGAVATSVQRLAHAKDGRIWQASVYGRRLAQKSLRNIPLQGIGISGWMAVQSSSVRLLEKDEPVPPLTKTDVFHFGDGTWKPTDPVCGVSGLPAAEGIVALQADRAIPLCDVGHLGELDRRLAIEEDRAAPAAAPDWSLGRKRVLFIRVRFPDDPTNPLEDSDAAALFAALKEFFRVNSGGALTLDFTLTPVLTLPRNKSTYAESGASGYLTLRDNAREAVRGLNDPKLVPEQFDLDCIRFVPVFSSFSGIATVGDSGCWLQTSDPSVASHELGHNLGLTHANAWYLETPEKISSGRRLEYRNPFDVMGSGTFPGCEFGANRKWQLGWLPSDLVVQITRSGTYRLGAHDSATLSNTVPRILTVPRKNGSLLSLELRSPKTSAGKRTPGPLLFLDDQLLDASPRSENIALDFEDASLEPGRIYADPESDIWIQAGNRSGVESDSIEVTIQLGREGQVPLAAFTVEPQWIETRIGEQIRLKAVASDPLAELGAISWDLGNGLKAYGTEVQFSYDRNGEQLVRAEAVNLSGATRTNWVLVRVGNSRSLHHVSGRVTYQGNPLPNAEIRGNGSKGFTDASGNYALPNLTNGVHTLTLIHPVAPYNRTLSIRMNGDSLTNVNFVLVGPEIASVRLTEPTEGSMHPVNHALRLSAEFLVEPGASIARVEYFDGGNQIAIGDAPPFAATWNQPVGGSHFLKAVAVDQTGRHVASESVGVNILEKPPAEDAIVNALNLPTGASVTTFHNIHATRADGESGEGDASVWYSWTATSGEFIDVHAEPVLGGNLWLEAYRKSSQDSMESVGLHHQNRAIFRATPGETYLFRIATSAADAGFFNLSLNQYPAPKNDAYSTQPFSASIPAQFSLSGNTLGATRELNEPAHGGIVQGGSVWWSFTLASDGIWEIDSDNPNIHLALYTRNAAWPPTPLGHTGQEVVWAGNANTAYSLAAAGDDLGAGPFTWRLIPAARAWNDTLATAYSPQGLIVWDYETPIVSGTADATEPVLIPGNPKPPVVWWTWTAPRTNSMILRLSTVDPQAISAVAIYPLIDGIPGLPIAQSTTPATSQALEFRPTVGTQYVIAISATRDSAYRLRLHPNNGNDYFDEALALSGDILDLTGNAALATSEPGEPNTIAGPPRRTVWWRWKAEKSEAMSFQVKSTANTLLELFTGTELRKLTRVAIASGSPNTAAKAFLQANAGTEYWIRLDVLSSPTADFTLTLEPALLKPSVNDLFQNRIRLGGESFSVIANTRGAKRQSDEGEPLHGGRSDGASLWWEWVAPVSGGFAVRAESASDVFVGVYEYDWAEDIAALGAVAGETGRTATAGFHAEKGHSYFIVADHPIGRGTQVQLSLDKGPTNDDFNSAILLDNQAGETPVQLTGSSLESDERPHGTMDERGSVWYQWTAPESGGYLIELKGTNGPYSLAAYIGNSLTNLARFSIDTVHSLEGSRTVLIANQGVSYVIAVTGPGGTSAPGTLRITRGPPNDAFDQRRVLEGVPLELVENSAGATLELGEPPHSSTAFGASVWYSWTAPRTGGVVMTAGDTAVANANPAHSGAAPFRLAAYEGTQLEQLQRVAQSDQGIVTFRAIEGTHYAIAIADPQSIGTSFHFKILPAPLNDDFEARELIEIPSFSLTGTTLGGTLEPNEPRSGPGQSATLWWQWIAPQSGGQSVEVRSSGSRIHLEIYEGTAFSSLSPVSQSHFTGAETERTSFRSIAGHPYQIVLSTDDPLGASYQLQLKASPSNDDWSNAIERTDFPVQESQNVAGATFESFESNRLAKEGGTVWYRWKATISGPVEVTATGSSSGARLRIYEGDPTKGGHPIAEDTSTQSSRPTAVRLTAKEGIIYSIAVSPLGGMPGEFSWRIDALELGDDADTPWILTNATGTYALSFAASTKAPGEYATPGVADHGSVWFQWKPTTSGGYSIRAALTNAAAVLLIHARTPQGPGPALTFAAATSAGSQAQAALRAEAETEYFIEVTSKDGVQGQVRIEIQTSPENDDFERAAQLGCCGVSTAGLTRQPVEPPSLFTPNAGSLWWKWTSPTDGIATVTGNAPGANFGLAIFQGTQLDSLAPVGRSSGSNQIRVSFQATAGTTYSIAGEFTNGSPTILMTTEVARSPINDSFSRRTVLSGRTIAQNGTTVGATREMGEPLHREAQTGASVWYGWTAPSTELYQVGLGSNGSPQTTIALYQGTSLATLKRVATTKGGRFTIDGPAAIFKATAGQSYIIALEDDVPQENPFLLRIQPKPVNDDFDNRLVLTGKNALSNSSNVGATSEAIPGTQSLKNSTWYSWTSPSDGYVSVAIDPLETQINALVNLYYMDQLGRLNWLGAGGANPVIAEFFASANTEYVFEVATTPIASSRITVQISLDDLGGTEFLSSGQWFKKPPGGNLSWVVGPVAPWFTESSTVLNAPDAARSSPSVLGTTWMEAAVEGPATLKFWWKVSCHPTEAFLGVYNRSLPGGEVPLLQISGERGWQPVTLSVPKGRNLLRWGYTRRTTTGIQGRDAGWVDQLEILPEQPDGAVFNQAFLSTDGEQFRATLQTNPGRLTELQVSEDFTQWQSWFSTVTAGDQLQIPAIAISNRPALFIRALTR